MLIQDSSVYNNDVAAREKKAKWGGQRRGAGRNPILKDAVSFTGDIEKADMDALEAMAEKRSVSVASLVREAVKAFLKRRRKR